MTINSKITADYKVSSPTLGDYYMNRINNITSDSGNVTITITDQTETIGGDDYKVSTLDLDTSQDPNFTTLTTTGNGEIGGTLTITSSMSAASLSTSGSATVGNALTVTNGVSAATLSSSGNATIGGTATVTSSLSAASLSTSGNGTIGGALTVTGNASAVDVTASGNVTAALFKSGSYSFGPAALPA